MTETQRTPTRYSELSAMHSEATGWVGWVLFAGVMLVLLGAFQAIAGLVGIFNDSYYLVRPGRLALHVDYTVWGWFHLALGVVAIFGGYGVMRGATWARVFAVLVATISAVANLAFIGAYPIWGAIIIAVDVLVIYAVCVHGREVNP
jgi:hypothetical protein